MIKAPVNRNALWTFAVVCLLAIPSSGAAASLLEPQLDEDDNYSETLTAIADLEDGTYVQLQLNVSNLGVGDANGACRMLVVEPDQKAWTASDRVGRDSWKASASELSVTTCSAATAGGATTIQAKLEKGAAKLAFAAAIQPRSPPDAKVTVEGKSFAYAIAIPWAKVEATFTVPGRGERKLTGFGYMDHSRSTTLPAQLATRWVRYRGLSGGDSVLLLARNLPDGTLRGWLWREKEPFARPLAKLKLNRIDAKDQAKGYTIEGAAGDLTFTITSESQLYRYAPVEEYGVLGVLARSVVGNPVTRTYRATLDAQPATPPNAKRGILEVQHVQ
ncbi:MAG: hypothetical protein ACAI38_15325 [Myxococcota bacterium]